MSQTKQASLSLTEFIIRLCRKFSLLCNERTSILSQPDEIQLVQYCLACHRQKVKGDFDASQAETLEMEEKIKDVQIRKLKNLLSANTFLKEEDSLEDPNNENILNLGTPSLKLELDKVNEENEFFCDSDKELNEVLALLMCHKEASNHQSILDCYIRFLQELSNHNSELHLFLKSCNDIEVLGSDELSLGSVQTDLYEELKHLNPHIKLHNQDQNQDLLMEEESPTEVFSSAVTIPEFAKTPSRIKLSDNSLTSPLQVSTPKTPFTPANRRETHKAFVHDLFRSYIHLLVNSCSQLALARVFNIPERGLDHIAFTHVKHEARVAGLSMYQFLASFIMRIRLGGQGYAPSSDAPLMGHIKGLSSLVDFIQKLQTTVEEITDLRRACCRVVNIIKNNLIQCKSGKFTRSLVEPCAKDIQTSLIEIIDTETVSEGSPPKTTGSGGSLLGRRCLRVLQNFLDKTALQKSTDASNRMLQDLSFSQTPTRIPCLLSQFRSPSLLEVKEDDNQRKKSRECLKSVKQKSCFVSSALYLEDDEQFTMTQGTLSSIEVLPSKTLVEPKACDRKDKENLITSTALHTITAQANTALYKQKQTGDRGKRKDTALDQEHHDSDIVLTDAAEIKRAKKSSEGTTKSSKKASDQLQKPGKSCRKRLLPQVKGQSKITGFFRV